MRVTRTFVFAALGVLALMSVGVLYTLHSVHGPHAVLQASESQHGVPIARHALAAAPLQNVYALENGRNIGDSNELVAEQEEAKRALHARLEGLHTALGAHGKALTKLKESIAESDKRSEQQLKKALAELHDTMRDLPNMISDAAGEKTAHVVKAAVADAMLLLAQEQQQKHQAGGLPTDKKQAGGKQIEGAKAGAPNIPTGDNNDDVDAYGDPKPRTPFPEFLAIVQAHLNGEISHNVMLEYLGVKVAALAAVRPWTRHPVGAETLGTPYDRIEDEDGVAQAAKVRAMLVKKGFLAADVVEGADVGQLSLAVWAPKRCMEQNETQNGKVIVLRPCSLGGSFQQWKLQADGRISGGVNQMGDDCLAMPSLGVGENVQTTDCSRDDRTQVFLWRVHGPHRQVGELVHKDSGLCVGVSDARPESELPILQVQRCRRQCNQLWTIDSDRTSYLSLPIDGGVITDTAPRHDLNHLGIREDDNGNALRDGPPRIACWIMTSPKNHETKAFAVNATWANNCDVLLYMTTEHHAGLNTVVLTLGEKEDRHFLWRKSILSWSFLYVNLLEKADWFMRADDDTYVNMDTLRSFLADYDHDEPHFFGRRLNVSGSDFFSGGSTNIMSRAALQQLGDAIKTRGRKILNMGDTFADDLELGNTMARIGIKPEDTRDEGKHERFHVLSIMDERKSTRKAEPDYWYWDFSYYPPKEGSESSSPSWVASHYISPEEMLTLEALHELKCEGAGQQPWDAASTFSEAND